MSSVYKSFQAKEAIFELYDEKLKSLNIDFQEIDIKTSFGNTRVLKTGNESGKMIVLFHGINAGSPVALEAVKELRDRYLIYAIDTIGQATKSDETMLNVKDESFAVWADEVLDGLKVVSANFIGVSYGGFILQKLITYKPQRVEKCIFIVPGGLANGQLAPSIPKLFWPLMKFMITKKDYHLKQFLSAFIPEDDSWMYRLQKQMLLGVKMDYRKPPLLKADDVKHFTQPVYFIVADNDIFFPGDSTISNARDIFKNLQGVHVLENCKHMPHKSDFPEIQQKITEWIS